LPEVEQTCERVIIINKGKLVATDSVNNLQSRARGAELVLVEVAGRSGALDYARVQERLEKVAGVGRVAFKERKRSGATFEVESVKDKFVRGDLARAVVEAGWDLNELRTSAVSLEEVFLQLTGAQAAQPGDLAPAKETAQ
jgi:ABC-2 type transport system ATP-binding protein